MLEKSRKTIDAATARIFERLAAGHTDADVRRELNLDPENYKFLRRLMLEKKAAELRDKPQDHAYIEYVLEQRGNIRALENVVKELRGSNQHNAMIGALRLKADLVDRILDRSQEFGLVKKAPDRKVITAGIMVQDLSNDDLIKAIDDQMETFRTLVGSYGEGKSFLALPARPTHYGPRADDIPGVGMAVEDDDEDDEAELVPKPPATKKKAAASSHK